MHLVEGFQTFAGAAGLGVVSTFFLPNTLEDLLAVAVGGAVGYAALLNLPLKRGDAKEKLTRVATNFAQVGASKTQSMPPCLEFEFYKISVFWKADSTLNSALQDLEEKLIKELNEAVDKCMRDVNAFMEPLQRHSEGIVARIEDLQQREGTLMEELSEIQQQAANIE